MNREAILICGDLMWALSGDPTTHPIATDIIGIGVKAKVKAKVTAKPKPKAKAKPKPKPKATPKPGPRGPMTAATRLFMPAKPAPSLLTNMVKAAKGATKTLAKQTAKQRAQVAKQRLATRPAAKVQKAKATATRLKALPLPAQKTTVERIAQAMTLAPPTKPAADFLEPRAPSGPNYSPVVSESQPWDLPEPSSEPSGPNEMTAELQDVADAVWADQAYDYETEAEDTEADDAFDEDTEEEFDEEAEPEEAPENEVDMYENEVEELGVDLIGWNPFTAIKKGIQKGASFVSKVAKSDLMKATAAGLAVVYPPVGAPLSTTLPIAAGIADAVKSKDPKKRAAAIKVVKNTAALAKKGDKDAGRALSTIAMMRKLKSPSTNDAWRKAVIKALASAA